LLTLEAEGESPSPRLSRLLLCVGALAAADVVSQTLLLELCTSEDEVAAAAQMMLQMMVKKCSF
jgi:hypothetical protein